MQVTKEPLDPCQVALTIEVETGKVAQAVDKAYREYSKYISVPGFRKGKAPLNFVKQRVPEADVRQRTAELLVEPAYAEALEQEAIEPFAQPKLELMQLEFAEKPFIFKAVIPLRPEVELGQYTGLTVEKNKYELNRRRGGSADAADARAGCRIPGGRAPGANGRLSGCGFVGLGGHPAGSRRSAAHDD